MIKDTDKRISNADLVFSIKNNGSGSAKDGKKKQNKDKQRAKSLSDIFAEIDKRQIKPQSNPFETKRTSISLIQEDFNKKFYSIKQKIEYVYDVLQEDGDIQKSYIYTLNLADNVYYNYFHLNKTNISGIPYIFNEAENKLVSFDMKFEMFFDKSKSIKKVFLKEDKFIYELNFKKQNALEKLFGSTQNQIEKFSILDEMTGIKEQIVFSQKDIVNCYSKSLNDSKIIDVVFEKNEYSVFENYQKNKKYQISSYSSFENGCKKEEIKYVYGLPCEYREFSLINQQVEKLYLLQGIKAMISKYTCFDYLSGHVIASGNLINE